MLLNTCWVNAAVLPHNAMVTATVKKVESEKVVALTLTGTFPA
jgi:hypothetical protein